MTNSKILLKVLLAEMTENETFIAKNMAVNGQKMGYVTKISSKLLTVQGYQKILKQIKLSLSLKGAHKMNTQELMQENNEYHRWEANGYIVNDFNENDDNDELFDFYEENNIDEFD